MQSHTTNKNIFPSLIFSFCNFQFAVIFLILFFPAAVFAHGMDVYASVEGRTIQGKAEYHGGTPVKNAEVTAYDPAGEEIGNGKTDEAGKFSLEARFHCEYRLLVDAGDGHGGEYTLSAKLLPEDLPERITSESSTDKHTHHEKDAVHDHEHQISVSTADIKHQTALLEDMHGDVDAIQEQIDQLKKHREFRDILGGIGFIVGIVGAAYGYYCRGLLRAGK